MRYFPLLQHYRILLVFAPRGARNEQMICKNLQQSHHFHACAHFDLCEAVKCCWQHSSRPNKISVIISDWTFERRPEPIVLKCMCVRVLARLSVAQVFASWGAAKWSWLVQLEYSRTEQLLWFGLIAVWRKWPREALFCQELFGRLQVPLPCSHTHKDTHTLLADLPLTYFHFILLGLLNSTRAIGILAVCQTNHEIMRAVLPTLVRRLMTHVGSERSATKMAQRNTHTHCRLKLALNECL